MDWSDIFQALMGAGGAYAGYKAGGPQTQTTTTAMSPEMQGQWNAFRDFANEYANQPYQPGVAPFSQDQYGAMDQVRNLAGGGAEQLAGSRALQGFLGGGAQNPFMGDNPYLQGLINQTSDSVQNRMGTGAFASGSFGNSGVAAQTAKALADSENNLRYQNYQQSAQLGENALNRTASMVPQALGYQQQGLNNASTMLQTGAMQQQQGQRMLDDYLQYPQRQLNIMGQPLNLGQGSTSTTNVAGNPYASALGGGLFGLNFGNIFGK